ncbi:MAG: hypothetical protein GY701_10710 [Sulfitobacter sp.]|nr:hypothetical protein [Sulfitobacter sp.]
MDGNHSHAAPAVAGDDEEVDSDADDEAEAGEPDAAADEGGESDDDSHDLTTHEPKCLKCQVCLDSKTQRKSRRRGGLAMGPRPKQFGEQCTGDHLFSKEAVENTDPWFPNASTAVVMHDRATQWLDCFPKATKSHADTVEAFHEFAGTRDKIKQFYCDNSHELLAAARTVGWRCPTATPGVPQTNGLAERMVRKVKEGARCLLVQAGLPPKWWTYAVRAFCFAHNIKMRNGDYLPHTASKRALQRKAHSFRSVGQVSADASPR